MNQHEINMKERRIDNKRIKDTKRKKGQIKVRNKNKAPSLTQDRKEDKINKEMKKEQRAEGRKEEMAQGIKNRTKNLKKEKKEGRTAGWME